MAIAATIKHIRLGDLLVQGKVISETQLNKALQEQKRSGRKLGRVLVELGIVEEDKLLNHLAEQLGIPFVDLKHYKFVPETVRILPEIYARRFRAIVLEEREHDLLVGIADPTDIFAYDKLSALLKQPFSFALVREADLLSTVDIVYRRTDEISTLAEELGEEVGESDFDIDQLLAGADVSDAPVVKLIHSVFQDAVQVGASDIHIEPDEAVLRVRQRIDGVLHEQVIPERRIASAVATRLKLMSGLDIAEKRMPQDGRFSMKIQDINMDVRVSTMPTQYGESIVMRLLNQSAGFLELSELGMPKEMLPRFLTLIHKPHGMVLVTGPTGSGKTTTLYAALSELNNQDKKLITVEDPVEYRLPRVNQVQINEKIELHFADVLRAALRQDPDVILVGEIRDHETAQIAVRASMTGHLVLSTLHTNDAISTAIRLMDMGVEGYLAAAALRAVVAQRLVRRICISCIAPHEPDAQQAAWLRELFGSDSGSHSFMKGRGCARCNQTGYRGRIGVYELLEPNEVMLEAMRKNDLVGFMKAAKKGYGYRPLSLAGLDYAIAGITTLDEVQRIAGEIDEGPALPDTGRDVSHSPATVT
ncbi:MAG: MSHA fimbrial ATPase MshE [Gammaproteobacteria bacterium]|nr:MAG: MSHA fimbrial ATPase MshE [Gammaproteobacteria bacterium]